MGPDPDVLLCLLAVRLRGGKQVPAGSDLFKKGLKTAVQQAIERGCLRQQKADVPTGKTTRKGKPATKKIDVLELTDEGDRLLRQAATGDSALADAVAFFVAVRRNLEADCQALR